MEVETWERKNKELSAKIQKSYKDYKKKNKLEFKKDEYKAHINALNFSSKLFKNEIENQVKNLLIIRNNFLVE